MKSVLLGGAAWVSVSAVLAVAVAGQPIAEHRADPAQPSPSTLPGEQTRDSVVTRSTGADREARVSASPSADASRLAAERTLRESILKAIEDTAGAALAASPDATPAEAEASPGPSAELESTPDSSGNDSSEPEPSKDPEPSDDDEPAEEQSDGPGPSLELPTEPTLPPIGLP